MKLKQFIHGITFFTTLQMYQEMKKISDFRQISLSELLREIIEKFLAMNK